MLGTVFRVSDAGLSGLHLVKQVLLAVLKSLITQFGVKGRGLGFDCAHTIAWIANFHSAYRTPDRQCRDTGGGKQSHRAAPCHCTSFNFLVCRVAEKS